MSHVRWKSEPDEHDYSAARDYLELLVPPMLAERLTAAFRDAPSVTKKSKDLLRASGLATLAGDNPHVAKDLRKIHSEIELSPVFVVRGEIRQGVPLIVADGYHRICAVHLVDEDAEISCRIIEFS